MIVEQVTTSMWVVFGLTIFATATICSLFWGLIGYTVGRIRK